MVYTARIGVLRAALDASVDHVIRGRSAQVRAPTASELQATAVLRLPISEASAKVRTGFSVEAEEDYAWPCWAGVLPLRLQASAPLPDPRLAPDVSSAPAEAYNAGGRVASAAHWKRAPMDRTALFVALLAMAAVSAAGAAYAEPMTRDQIAERLRVGDANLRSLEAPSADLSGLDFRGADLFGAKLSGADLTQASLRGCNLDIAIMRETKLIGADLRDASLFGTQLMGADLRKANLQGARLMGNLEGAVLDGANLRDVRGGADMRNQPMGLIRAVLKRASLQSVRLNGADLSRADLSFADLRNADLSGTNLSHALLVGADLRGATLDDAVLEAADVAQANFTGAKGVDRVRGLDAALGRESAIFD